MSTREIDLETATLSEMENENAWLRDEILAIDSQLQERRNAFHKKELKAPDYWDWRSQAVAAKSIKTRQLALVRDRLMQLRREARDEDRNGPREEWRRRCFALVDVLERLREMPLGEEASDLIDGALIAFRGHEL